MRTPSAARILPAAVAATRREVEIAVRGTPSPVEGSVVFRVLIGAGGIVDDVRLESGSSSDWGHARNALLAQLRGRALTPDQAAVRGFDVLVAIESGMFYPSGGRSAVSLEGPGARFDLSDIGARPSRSVRTRVSYTPR